jgi:tetratricopeptide (TPR) repeat protein
MARSLSGNFDWETEIPEAFCLGARVRAQVPAHRSCRLTALMPLLVAGVLSALAQAIGPVAKAQTDSPGSTGDLATATAVSVAACRRFPRDFWVCCAQGYLLSIVLTKEEETDGAEPPLRELIRIEPDLAERPDAPTSMLENKRDLASDAHYKRGTALSAQGMVDEAIAELREAIRIKPESFLAHGSLGDALASQGKLDEATAEYGEANRLKPDPADFIKRGRTAFKKKEYNKAIVEYDEAIRIDCSCRAYEGRGFALLKKKEYDKAITDFNMVIWREGESTRVYVGRGWAWLGKKAFEMAIDDFNNAIARNPCAAVPYLGRGIAWSYKNDHEREFADYDHAIRLDPHFAQAYTQRGQAWSSKKEYDKAIADFNSAIRIDPQDFDALNGRAWLWATCPDTKNRDGKQAIESAKQACELTKWKHASMIGTLAAAYAETGDFEAAGKRQTEAIGLLTDEKEKDDFRTRLKLYQDKKAYRQLKPELVQAKRDLHIILTKERKANEREPPSREPAGIKPEVVETLNPPGPVPEKKGDLESDAHYKRGTALSAQRKVDEAIAELREAIRIEPENREAHRSLGDALASQGKVDEATAEYGAASRPKPDPPDHIKHGRAAYEKKDYDKAIAEYDEAIRIDPLCRAYDDRGFALLKKKEYDKAITDFSMAIWLDGKFTGAYAGRVYAGRGWAWLEKKEFDKAIDDFSYAITCNPGVAGHHLGRGIAWSFRYNHEREIADFDEAIRLDPQFARAYTQRGRAWSNKKEYDKAIADFNDAIRIESQHSDTLNDLAWLWATCPDATNRDGKKALESAKRACELTNWKHAYMIGTLAAAYAETGDFEAAVKRQTEAIGLLADEKEKDDFRTRLKLYQEKKAYRQPSSK